MPTLAALLAAGTALPGCHDVVCGASRADELEAHGRVASQHASRGHVGDALHELGVAVGAVAHTPTRVAARGEAPPVTPQPVPVTPQPPVVEDPIPPSPGQAPAITPLPTTTPQPPTATPTQPGVEHPQQPRVHTAGRIRSTSTHPVRGSSTDLPF